MKIREILNKIQTELHAPKSNRNDFGKYKYRSCEDILEAVKPLLKETGACLKIYDEVVERGNRIYVCATAELFHHECEKSEKTWAFAREPESRKGMDEAQVTGATSSYARKYALNGLLAIDDTKDADTMDKPKVEQPRAIEEIQNPIVKGEVLSLAKEKLQTADKFQEWRVANNFPLKIKGCTDVQLSSMLDLLNQLGA